MHFGKVIREMRLEAFSQRFARGLLERHPEWLPFLGAYEEEDDAGQVVRTLEVRVPSESPCYEEPLLIRVSPPETCTQGTFHRPADVPNAKPVVTRVRFTRFEVYLEWAGLHTHLFTEPEKDQDHLIREALDQIALWTSDDVLFATTYEGDCVIEASADRVGNPMLRITDPKPGRRTVVRSWRGTHDREIP